MSKVKFIFIAILFWQTSCATNLQTLANRESELKNRADYDSYLAREYLEMSRDLSDKYQWHDSSYFARKGLRAADDHEIYPEAPEVWNLDANQIEEANAAKNRLQFLLVPQVKKTLPIQLAHLVMLYDCWVSKEARYRDISNMSRCKIRFVKLLGEMEDYFINQKPTPEVKIEPVETKLEFKKFDIRFDFNSYKFVSTSDDDLREVLKYLETLNGDYQLLIVGRADRAGKKLYNDRIARERGLITKEYLMKNGVPERLIDMQSFSEDDSEIITKDNQRSKNNRRASIYVLKGKNDISTIPLPIIENTLYKDNIIEYKKHRAIR